MEGQDLEAEVIARMERYMLEVLEPRQASFGDLPACPFVRTERLKGRIRYELCEMLPGLPTGRVEHQIRFFAADNNHSTLLIIDPVCHLTKDQGVKYGIMLCEMVRDTGMVAICVHPDDDFSIAGFQPRNRIPYVTMLVQADKLVVDAKKTLEGTRYYDNWTKADLDYNFRQFGQFLNRA